MVQNDHSPRATESDSFGGPQALGSGHLVVQTLAGLSHTGEGPTALDEALRGFERRGEFDFHAFYRCTDPETARALAEAAQALGRKEQAAELLSRAR